MIDRIGTRNLGFAQLLLAAILLIIGITLAMSSWNRWTGISDIGTARSRLMEGNAEAAKSRASSAARALPNEPAAVLLDIDIAKDPDYARLETLERKTKGEQQQLVRTAEALSLIARKHEGAPEIAGADGVLLKALTELIKGSPPASIVLPKDSAPHYSVLVMTYVAQLQAALRVQDPVLVREAAGVLALLMPSHPEGRALEFVAGALDPACDLPRLQGLAQQVTDKKKLQAIAHSLAGMARERAAQLDAVVLGINPSSSPEKLLELQVQAAAAQDSGVDIAGLARRCFDAGRMDLAKLLLPKMPPTALGPMRSAILNQEGDVAELAKAGMTDATLAPRASKARCRKGLIAFQLSNDLGMVPKSAIIVKLNGVDVAADKITRNASLIAIDTALTGSVSIEVRAGNRIVYSDALTL